jgi:hypothetical protein
MGEIKNENLPPLRYQHWLICVRIRVRKLVSGASGPRQMELMQNTRSPL